MIIITNRKIYPENQGLEKFGGIPSSKPDEIRVVEVTKKKKKWDAQTITGNIIGKITNCLTQKRPLLVFVHGFSNTFLEVVKRAERLERLYDVDAIAFSWPAAGEGEGYKINYRGDKRDAEASTDAFGKCLGLIGEVCKTARPLTLNIMFHSMGNYLLKNFVLSNQAKEQLCIFDNVLLVAADTNNENHSEWVGKLSPRKKKYIVINKKDDALAVSARLLGEKQGSRLGHCLENLNAHDTNYINITNAKRVGKQHSYFVGRPVAANVALHQFFKKAFRGKGAERNLVYDKQNGVFMLPKEYMNKVKTYKRKQ